MENIAQIYDDYIPLDWCQSLENILLKTMFELPDMENVIKVTVDSAAVEGNSEPIVTYGKKSSTSVA